MAKISKDENNWISKELRFALASTYSLAEECITKEFLSTLLELNLSNNDLSSIKGIQHALNLTKLNLSKNNLKNISYLSDLTNIVDLDLSHNKIKKVNFLNNFTKLERVELNYNNISHLPDITDLDQLDLINIANNKIKDLTFIKTQGNGNLKVVANDQCILLNNTYIDYGEDFTFKPSVSWDEKTPVFFDNIQVDGNYEDLETDKRPSFLFSISKMILKNVKSNCVVKTEFYHEANFSKSGILSGILLQPIFVNLSNNSILKDSLRQTDTSSVLYGKLNYESNDKDIDKSIFLKNKMVTLIDPNGNKIYKFTNEQGEYRFNNLKQGRYTVLFPFVAGYEYKTQSLFFQNVSVANNIEVDATICKK